MDLGDKRPRIAYKSGYKYQIVEPYAFKGDICPDEPIINGFLALHTDGMLTINPGYAFDGPSGPTVDTKTFMRGALIHDAYYQLMRSGRLPRKHRRRADQILKYVCIQDGMSRIRAWWVYRAVRLGAGKSSTTEHRKKVLYAP